tara:strand:+ start:268 stop:495 length:228 start_codon:yes stop_codon:yes gene_type:complete
VATKDLGSKLICKECEANFYDLKKKPPICPKCGAKQPVFKPKTRSAAARQKQTATKPAEKEEPKNEKEIDLAADD